jgi:hypothetical protein
MAGGQESIARSKIFNRNGQKISAIPSVVAILVLLQISSQIVRLLGCWGRNCQRSDENSSFLLTNVTLPCSTNNHVCMSLSSTSYYEVVGCGFLASTTIPKIRLVGRSSMREILVIYY